MDPRKPGVKYIYERQGGIVYAREFGAPTSQRAAIAHDWEVDDNPSRVKSASIDTIRENQLWYKIREAAMSNPSLQDAIERVKILYYLSQREDGNRET